VGGGPLQHRPFHDSDPLQPCGELGGNIPRSRRNAIEKMIRLGHRMSRLADESSAALVRTRTTPCACPCRLLVQRCQSDRPASIGTVQNAQGRRRRAIGHSRPSIRSLEVTPRRRGRSVFTAIRCALQAVAEGHARQIITIVCVFEGRPPHMITTLAAGEYLASTSRGSVAGHRQCRPVQCQALQ